MRRPVGLVASGRVATSLGKGISGSGLWFRSNNTRGPPVSGGVGARPTKLELEQAAQRKTSRIRRMALPSAFPQPQPSDRDRREKETAPGLSAAGRSLLYSPEQSL